MQLAIARQNQLFAMYKRCNVLIIEDSAQARGILRGMLRELSVEQIDMASSGQEGVEKMRARPYNIVLCDYNLGKGKDGQQVLEEARFSKYLKFSTVFIMITAESTVEMVMGALEYQPDSYLSKPFTKQELRTRLDRALHGKLDYQTIDQAMEREDLRKAIGLCDERIAAENPPPMRALRVKSECHLRLKEYELARTVYEGVIAERDIPWAQIGLGKAEFFLDNFAHAEAIFKKLIEQQPSVVESYDWLAKTQLAQGEPRLAQDTIELATVRSPKAVLRQMELAKLALSNRSYLVAEKAYRKAILLANDSVYRSPENFLQYVRALLVKIDGKGGKLSNAAFDEAVLFLQRLRKEFKGSKLVDFRATMLECLVEHNNRRAAASATSLARSEGMFEQLSEKSRQAFADEFVTTLAMTGHADRARHFIAGYAAEVQDLDLVHHLEKRVESSERRLFSEAVNEEAMALYQRGQVTEAYVKFSEAASAPGASMTVLLNALAVCVELAERPDLNTAEWRRECEIYIKGLQLLDRHDHRYEQYQTLCARLEVTA